MARLPRICPPGIPQHLVQRGNNRQACFATDSDFAAYAHWLHESSCRYGVAIHAWVFMTNHVHLLATPQTPDGISRMMQQVGRRYVRYFNRVQERTGTLWEGRFRSCVVDAEHYLLTCQRYIELNPVRAGMVTHPSDYPWSSFQSHTAGVQARLWSPHEVYLRLGAVERIRAERYRDLFRARLDQQLVEEIRSSVNKGLALGGEQFKTELERATGRRMRPGKRGPRQAATTARSTGAKRKNLL